MSVLVLTSLACSSGGSSGTPGVAGASSGGSSAGSGGVASGGGGVSSAGGGVATAGGGGTLAGSGGSAGGASGAGSAAGGAAGAGAPSAGASGASGSAGNAGAGVGGGAPGPSGCAGRALSLSANATGSATDTAHSLVAMDLMADLPIGNADRTIELWLYAKPTDWVAERNEIWVYGVPNGTLTQVGLDFGMPAVKGMPNNHATLGPYTDGIYDDDTGVYLGIDSAAPQWLHVAMTYDGAHTTLRTYVNGALRITTTPATANKLVTTVSPFYMGCNPPYYGCFNGLVDELRIWNVVRTDAEIMGAYNKALVGDEPGLVGYYKFDDAPGSTTAVDSVKSAGHTAHNGTLMAVTPDAIPTFVTPDPLPPVACP